MLKKQLVVLVVHKKPSCSMTLTFSFSISQQWRKPVLKTAKHWAEDRSVCGSESSSHHRSLLLIRRCILWHSARSSLDALLLGSFLLVHEHRRRLSVQTVFKRTYWLFSQWVGKWRIWIRGWKKCVLWSNQRHVF